MHANLEPDSTISVKHRTTQNEIREANPQAETASNTTMQKIEVPTVVAVTSLTLPAAPNIGQPNNIE